MMPSFSIYKHLHYSGALPIFVGWKFQRGEMTDRKSGTQEIICRRETCIVRFLRTRCIASQASLYQNATTKRPKISGKGNLRIVPGPSSRQLFEYVTTALTIRSAQQCFQMLPDCQPQNLMTLRKLMPTIRSHTLRIRESRLRTDFR